MPNDGTYYTVKLNIKRIQAEEDFIDDSFNAVIDDIDNKVVGIDHLTSGAHWHIWEANTAYNVGDVIRWPSMKSHQYAKCIQAGTTNSTRPAVNVTGSEVTNGTTKWKIVSFTSTDDVNGGAISIWQGGGVLYERGDAVLYASSLYRCKVASYNSSNNFEADKDNWQEVYASIRPWEENKFYYKDDVVIVGLFIYKCLSDHTSASSFNLPAEKALWSLVGDFSTVKEWDTDTRYVENQLVTINGILYRSLYTHTSDSTDVINDMDFWEPVFASVQSWVPNTYYSAGTVVLANNLLYKCISPHKSGNNFADDTSNWALVHKIPASIDDWDIDIVYSKNQIVRYGGNLYRASEGHVSNINFDPTKWTLLTDSINDWVASQDYMVGQYVNYNGSLYKCITSNNDTNFTASKWQKVSGGGIGSWTASNDYSVGDIVVYNNKIYSCNTAHTSGATFTSDEDKWAEISACITRIPNWEADTEYVVGDLVAHDAKIYRCTTAHTSDPTQWDNTEEANWEELSPTINEISSWAVSTDYEVGQLVIYNNKLYRCSTAHTSTNAFNNDIANWGEIGGSSGIAAWRAGELYTQGSMVVYNNKIYVCDTAHTSANPFDQTKWHEISANDIDMWQTSTSYLVGDIVIYNNQLYRCTTAHTSDSSDFYTDIGNWDILDTKWILNNWTSSIYYRVGEVVSYNNTPYKCITAHTSLGTFELDKADWEPLSANIREWVSGSTYKVGDTVRYDGELYECITATNASTFKKSCWKPICKCNISMWSASDDSTIALLHFNTPSNIYANECGDSFTKPSDASSTYPPSNSWHIGDSGYAMSNQVHCGIESPWYNLSSAEDVYTIEWWFYCTGVSGATAVNFANIQYYNPTYDRGFNLTDYLGSDYYQTIALRVGGTGVSTMSVNTPYHIAVILTNTTAKVFVNGTTIGTYTIDAPRFRIYSVSDNNTYGHHYIDELRISNIARYTSDFTPPTEPFSAGNAWGYKKDDLVVYDDKLYRCITANDDDVFTPSKWVEVSPCIGGGIEEWTSGSNYNSGEVIIYNNNLYKVINDVTSATDTPDNSSDYVKLGGDIIDYATNSDIDNLFN